MGDASEKVLLKFEETKRDLLDSYMNMLEKSRKRQEELREKNLITEKE